MSGENHPSIVVGYNNAGTAGNASPSIGASFVPVSGAKTFKLKEIVPNGCVYGKDIFQLLNPQTTVADAQYTYFSQEMADQMKVSKPQIDWDSYVGWWDLNLGGYSKPAARADDVDIDVGQGFLGAMRNEVTLQSSGQAPTDTTEISTDGNASPYVASYIPRAFPLKYLVAEGAVYGKDILQVLNPVTTVVDAQYTYFSQEMADQMKVSKPQIDWDSYIGWWDLNLGGYSKPTARADSVIVNPGDAFLGAMRNEVTLKFPSSTLVIEEE